MAKKARGRFDVWFVFGDGYVRFTSNPKRSLSPQEVIDELTEFFPKVRKGIAAQKRNAKRTAIKPKDGSGGTLTWAFI